MKGPWLRGAQVPITGLCLCLSACDGSGLTDSSSRSEAMCAGRAQARAIDEAPSKKEFADALAQWAQPRCARANYLREGVVISAEIAYDKTPTIAQTIAYELCQSLNEVVHPSASFKPQLGTPCEYWTNRSDMRYHHNAGISCNGVYTWQLPLGSNYRMPLGFSQFRQWIKDWSKTSQSQFSGFEYTQLGQLGDSNQPSAVRNSHPHLRMGNPTLDSIYSNEDADARMPADEVLLVKPEFALGYVTQGPRWGPRWVSWHFTKSHIGGQPRGSKEFYPDPDLLAVNAPQLAAQDFGGIGSIVHRGHLCRSNERSAGHRMYTDVYSNIVPQRKRSNSGVWRNLEQTYFDAVNSGQWDAFVISGPIYLSHLPLLTFGNVPRRPKAPFPHALFKIVTLVRPGMGATDITTSAIANKDVLVYAVVIPNVPTINDLSKKDRDYFYRNEGLEEVEPAEYSAESDDAQPSESEVTGPDSSGRTNPLKVLNFPKVWQTDLPLDFPGDPSKNPDAYRRTTWSQFQVPVWMIEALTGLKFFGAIGRRKLSDEDARALQRAIKGTITPVLTSLPMVVHAQDYPKTLCRELVSKGHVSANVSDCGVASH